MNVDAEHNELQASPKREISEGFFNATNNGISYQFLLIHFNTGSKIVNLWGKVI
jgi:hypothetical protein